jgi:hypothetical protein
VNIRDTRRGLGGRANPDLNNVALNASGF